MDRRIAELNIEHLRNKLAEECDAEIRQVMNRLLVEEEAKLRAILRRPASSKISE